MTARLRLVAWRVQPVIMADDGDTLTPVNVPPADIPAADWDGFKDGGDVEALAQIAEQLRNRDPM